MEKIRLVIAEERTLFRQGLAALLRECADFEIAGEAASTEEARMVCTRQMPDLVLLSHRLVCSETLPGLLDALRVCCPDAALVILAEEATKPDKATENCPSQRGEGVPVLHTDIDRQELHRALRAVVLPLSPPRPAPFPLHPITEREQEIIAHIAGGLSNKEIAQRLAISPQTVKNHVSHLLEKLAVADRTQLAVYAIEHHFDFSQESSSSGASTPPSADPAALSVPQEPPPPAQSSARQAPG